MGRSPNTPSRDQAFSEQMVQLQRISRVVIETTNRPREWREMIVRKINELLGDFNEDAARAIRGEGPVTPQK